MTPTMHRVISEQLETSETSLGVAEPIVVKLVEYGGFVSAMLVLCLFFRVLTTFVTKVKED